MASNADTLVREGIKAYRQGNKDEARNLLLQAVEVDDQNEQAWMWLSAVVDTAEDQQTCLENVLTINPNNEKAKQGLRILSEKADSSAAVSPSQPAAFYTPPLEEEDDPFAQVSFTQTEPITPPPPLVVDEVDEDELPSDTQWGTIETSSASALPQQKIEPSADEYDDWVAGLNLGSGDAVQLFGDAAPTSNDSAAFSASPFIGAESLFDDDLEIEIDDNPFGVSDDLLPPEIAMPPDDDDDDAFSARSFMIDDDLIDDDFEDELETGFVAEAPPLSPTPSETEFTDDTLFDSLGDDDGFDEDLYDDFDNAEFDDVDPEELFKFIPAEIKATRLPGTRERYPALVIIGLILLLLFNAGAIAAVLMSLSTG